MDGCLSGRLAPLYILRFQYNECHEVKIIAKFGLSSRSNLNFSRQSCGKHDVLALQPPPSAQNSGSSAVQRQVHVRIIYIGHCIGHFADVSISTQLRPKLFSSSETRECLGSLLFTRVSCLADKTRLLYVLVDPPSYVSGIGSAEIFLGGVTLSNLDPSEMGLV